MSLDRNTQYCPTIEERGEVEDPEEFAVARARFSKVVNESSTNDEKKALLLRALQSGTRAKKAAVLAFLRAEAGIKIPRGQAFRCLRAVSLAGGKLSVPRDSIVEFNRTEERLNTNRYLESLEEWAGPYPVDKDGNKYFLLLRGSNR